MSRTLSQIYAEAKVNRDNYLQITELNSGRTKNKLSLMNMITYVMACLIHTYETVLDMFELNIADILSKRINGTPAYYATIAYKFQFNQVTDAGDPLVFDEETLKIGYQNVDESHRIIAKSAYEDYPEEKAIVLKVCKANTNDDEVRNGTLYMPLNNSEISAFKGFVDQIKFIGSNVYPVSMPGDIITISNCTVEYNDRYISKEQAFENVKNQLIDYAKKLDYNGFVYYQSVLDAIHSAEYIVNIHAGVEIYIQQYDFNHHTYREPVLLTDFVRTASGYVRFLSIEGDSTITEESINLIPSSEQ